MLNYRVYQGVDIDTDHRLLKATIRTPASRRARRRFNKSPLEPKPNTKSPLIPKVRDNFVKAVDQRLKLESPRNDDINAYSKNLIKLIEDAAKETLPSKIKKNHDNELWKDDETLNSLLTERSNLDRNGDLHKQLSKKIKKGI